MPQPSRPAVSPSAPSRLASSGRVLAGVRRPLASASFTMTPSPASWAAARGAASEGSRQLKVACTTSKTSSPSARAARADGELVFDVVQATFNCLEPSLAAPLAAAHDAGLGVIVKEALANGRLTPANTRPEDARLLGALGEMAGQLGCGLDQLALAFVLAQPFVDVVLSGAATTAQLASHLGALSLALDPEMSAALAALAEPPARYWQTRSTLRWS